MYGGGGNWGASACGLRLKGTPYRLKVQVHARGRTHLGHLVHPKATDFEMEYSDIPSANPSLYDPYKKKSPSGSEDPRMEPAEAAAEAKEQRDKGWNAKPRQAAMPAAVQDLRAVLGSGFFTSLRDPLQDRSEVKRLSCKMQNSACRSRSSQTSAVRVARHRQPGQERGLNRGAPGANEQSWPIVIFLPSASAIMAVRLAAVAGTGGALRQNCRISWSLAARRAEAEKSWYPRHWSSSLPSSIARFGCSSASPETSSSSSSSSNA